MILRVNGARWALGVLTLGVGLGCSHEREPQERAPRYYEDVAPLLNEHCIGCHRVGGIAPFALTSFEQASAHAGAIASATRTRSMPPMPVDNSGTCNTFSNARWLSQAEIQLLSDWASSGAAPGDPANAAAAAPRADDDELADADARLGLASAYTPHGVDGDDEYRCFVLPPAVEENAYLTAYQVSPGDARVVHHVILYQPVGTAAEAAALALTDEDPEPGYACFGSAGVRAEPLALWAPGSGVTRFPAGTGLPLVANRRLVMQVHYNVGNGSFPARTEVSLKLSSEPLIPSTQLSVANERLQLPPGQELVESKWTATFEPPASFTVYGAMPHMHTLGRTLRVDGEVNGASQCLVNVDRWDFHWQNSWWYTTPLSLSPLHALSIRCGFDTTTRSEPVVWGDRTSDEMCIAYFYLTAQRQPEPPPSCDDAENPLFGSCVDTFLSGCYEPDLSAACQVESGNLSFADGSRIVQQGADPGFYAAGEAEPCITLRGTSNGAELTRGAQTLSFAAEQGRLAFRCPDGSELAVSSAQYREFGICRGLSCPP